MNVYYFAITLMLVFSGTLKLIYFKYTKSTIMRLEIFPPKMAKMVPYGMPVAELAMAIGFAAGYKIVGVVYLAYLLFFVLLNFKTFTSNEKKECCCYGKLIRSKLGLGGMLHYLYWIAVLIVAIFCRPVLPTEETMLIHYAVGVLVVVTGLFIRMIVESVE